MTSAPTYCDLGGNCVRCGEAYPEDAASEELAVAMDELDGQLCLANTAQPGNHHTWGFLMSSRYVTFERYR